MSNVQPHLVLRAKLYEAITSGHYVQAQGSYRRPPTVYEEGQGGKVAFCILGLAYHLMDGKHWERYFHDELEEAYGFKNTVTLMSLNDTGCSFHSLAKIIRDHPDFIYKEKLGYDF